MSQEPRAQPNGEPCPACGAAAPPGILNRPPLELRFCGSCGMLLGAQVLRDRAGIEPEKLPTPLFSVSLKSPPEQRSPLVAAPAGGPRALTPPPPPVESQLRPPPAPGTAPPAAGPPPPPPSVSVVPGQVAPPPAPAAPAAVAGASVDLQPFLRTLTPSRLKAPHPPGAAAPRPSHPPLGADRSAVAPATASTPLPTLEPGFGYPRILLGDAADGFRDLVRDALLVSGVAEDVVVVRDGGQVILEFTRCCRAGTRPDLVVLDPALPLLDGKNVAILLRSIEDAYSLDPVPILFYMPREPDAALTQLMSYLKNARHLQRDAAAPPQAQASQLADHLVEG